MVRLARRAFTPALALAAWWAPFYGYWYGAGTPGTMAGQVRVKPQDPPADLMAGLKSKDAPVRRQAAVRLGEIRARGAVRGLSALVSDSEPGVREAAVFALGQIADPAAKALIV